MFVYPIRYMRGQQSLYNDLFPSSVTTNPERFGKRNAFMNERDEALACRYYFHAEIKRRRYDDALLELEKEFFLTSAYIMQRLALSTSYIKELVAEKTNTNSLKAKYNFYNWN